MVSMNNVLLINKVTITDFKNTDELLEYLNYKKGPMIINFLYWVTFAKSRKSEEYAKALMASDLLLPDGVGLLTYIKLTQEIKCQNLNGTDLSPILLNYFKGKGKPIALYGTTKESIERCYSNLTQKGIPIYYHTNGYEELNFVNIKDNSVLFVGLGSPKQEIWAFKNKNIIERKKIIVITIGGYFDFESGHYKRAPKWVIKMKCEWVYRIFDNPRLQIPKYVNNLFFIPYLFEHFLRRILYKRD